MKHADFHTGLEFVASGGFRWRCTDVGARTILAIQLDRKDPHWYQGPPYIAKEVAFDEHEIERCHLTNANALATALREHKTMGHAGYPVDAVSRMMEARRAQRYPHAGVLRFDRCRAEGNSSILTRVERRTMGGWSALPAVSERLRVDGRTRFHCLAPGISRGHSCAGRSVIGTRRKTRAHVLHISLWLDSENF